MSNPPFGRPKALRRDKADLAWLNYTGQAELMFAEICARVSGGAVMVLPQLSVPPSLRQSWNWGYALDRETEDGKAFSRDMYQARRRPISGDTKKLLDANPGTVFSPTAFTTDHADDDWRGAKPKVEIVHFEMDEWETAEREKNAASEVGGLFAEQAIKEYSALD